MSEPDGSDPTAVLRARHTLGRVKRRATHEARRWWSAQIGPAPAVAPAAPQVFVRQERSGGARTPWPALPPPGYLGQLEPQFQAKLAAARAFVERSDCDFYHSTTMPSGEEIEGAWDLRGGEVAYLGGVPFYRRRVLECGPASGHLSWYMEAQEADVVSFDVGWDRCIDLLPRPGVDPEWARMDAMQFIGTVQNTWWYLHREFGSKVKKVYGDIYDMPGDLGTFDVAVFAAILLHLRNPFDALSQAAARTTGQIVVTEPLQHPDVGPDDIVMRWAPWDVNNPTNWWSMTPPIVIHMLEVLGFTHTEVTYSSHPHHLGHDLSAPATQMKMFTVVGTRP